MRNIFNIIIITLFMLFISGCTVKYSSDIKENGTVIDVIKITVPSDIGSTYASTTREYLEDMVKSKKEEYNLGNYNATYDIANDYSTVTLTGNHSSPEQFFSNGIFKALYRSVSVTRDNSNIIVNLSGLNDYLQEDLDNYPTEFQISFMSDYVIQDDNADYRNKLTGEYIWNITQDNFNKDIRLTLTSRKNITAGVARQYGFLGLPIIIIAILLIMFIIYLVMKQKAESINRI